jgi:chromosome segregation ATPase
VVDFEQSPDYATVQDLVLQSRVSTIEARMLERDRQYELVLGELSNFHQNAPTVTTLTAENRSFRMTVREIMNDVTWLKATIQEVAQKDGNVMAAIQALTGEDKRRQSAIQSITNENKSLKVAIEKLTKEEKDRRVAIQTLRSENQSLKDRFTAIQKTVEKNSTDVSGLLTSCNDSQEKLISVQNDVDVLYEEDCYEEDEEEEDVDDGNTVTCRLRPKKKLEGVIST